MKKQSILLTTAFIALFTCTCAIANENFDKANFVPGPTPPKGEHFKGPNQEAMKQRMVEFDQKLQLTEEQKAKIKKNQEKSREKMKKIMDQEKKLREEKHKIMEENKKEFEAILTDEQKETLKKMHEEKMKEWKEKKGQFKGKGGEIARPLPIKPKTETK